MMLRQLSSALNGMIATGLLAVALGACAGSGSSLVATCLDDSPACISKRKTTLNSLLADQNRSWIKRKPDPVVYATGVRLFAWRKVKGDLTCDELRSGISETGSARKTLSGQITGASRTRIGQIIALSDDVKKELRRTARGKRCPKG